MITVTVFLNCFSMAFRGYGIVSAGSPLWALAFAGPLLTIYVLLIRANSMLAATAQAINGFLLFYGCLQAVILIAEPRGLPAAAEFVLVLVIVAVVIGLVVAVSPGISIIAIRRRYPRPGRRPANRRPQRSRSARR